MDVKCHRKIYEKEIRILIIFSGIGFLKLISSHSIISGVKLENIAMILDANRNKILKGVTDEQHRMNIK